MLDVLKKKISCVKCTKHQQMHLNFIDVLSLCFGHRHDSATRVAIFRVTSLRIKSTVVIKTYLNGLTVLNPYNFWLKSTAGSC
jgi:hypothetical protein